MQTNALATVAGKVYQVSFWLANFVSTPVNTFQVVINGIVLNTNFGSTISAQNGFPTDGAYRQVFAQFTATGPSTLEFRYHHDSDFWLLDDVSVTAAPENGATLWLIIPAVGGIFLVHRRVRRGAEAC